MHKKGERFTGEIAHPTIDIVPDGMCLVWRGKGYVSRGMWVTYETDVVPNKGKAFIWNIIQTYEYELLELVPISDVS